MKYQLGLIPMSAKPFHAGHYHLVKKAVTECSSVKLFIGTGNRNKGVGKSISGEKMLYLWRIYFERYMPEKNNIEFIYEGVPVRNVYEELDKLKKENVDLKVAIYSGNEIEKNGKSLIWNRYNKIINDPYWNKKIDFISVERGKEGSPDISGTQMRNYLSKYCKDQFFSGLPDYLCEEQKLNIFNLLLI